MSDAVRASSFTRGERVRWLSGGEYHSGTVSYAGRTYVYVTPDVGDPLRLYPWALTREGRAGQ